MSNTDLDNARNELAEAVATRNATNTAANWNTAIGAEAIDALGSKIEEQTRLVDKLRNRVRVFEAQQAQHEEQQRIKSVGSLNNKITEQTAAAADALEKLERKKVAFLKEVETVTAQVIGIGNLIDQLMPLNAEGVAAESAINALAFVDAARANDHSTVSTFTKLLNNRTEGLRNRAQSIKAQYAYARRHEDPESFANRNGH